MRLIYTAGLLGLLTIRLSAQPQSLDLEAMRQEMVLPEGATLSAEPIREATLVIARSKEGNLISVSPFVNGVNHGLSQTFQPDGSKAIICYKEGKLLFSMSFDKNGKLVRGAINEQADDASLSFRDMWFSPEGLWAEQPRPSTSVVPTHPYAEK